MVAAPPIYDLMLLLDAAAPSERRAEILSQVETAIGASGTIVSKHAWGVRNLAYEIEHRAEADYELLQFTGPRELLEQLHRTLRLTDDVTRFRIIKLKPGTPEAPATAPPPPARVPATVATVAAVGPAAVAAPAGEGAATVTVTPPEAPAETVDDGASPEAAPAEAPAQDEAPAEPAAEEPALSPEAAAAAEDAAGEPPADAPA